MKHFVAAQIFGVDKLGVEIYNIFKGVFMADVEFKLKNRISSTGAVQQADFDNVDGKISYKVAAEFDDLVSIDLVNGRAVFCEDIFNLIASSKSDIKDLFSDVVAGGRVVDIKNVEMTSSLDLTITFETAGGEKYDFKLAPYGVMIKKSDEAWSEDSVVFPLNFPAYLSFGKDFLSQVQVGGSSTTPPLSIIVNEKSGCISTEVLKGLAKIGAEGLTIVEASGLTRSSPTGNVVKGGSKTKNVMLVSLSGAVYVATGKGLKRIEKMMHKHVEKNQNNVVLLLGKKAALAFRLDDEQFNVLNEVGHSSEISSDAELFGVLPVPRFPSPIETGKQQGLRVGSSVTAIIEP